MARRGTATCTSSRRCSWPSAQWPSRARSCSWWAARPPRRRIPHPRAGWRRAARCSSCTCCRRAPNASSRAAARSTAAPCWRCRSAWPPARSSPPPCAGPTSCSRRPPRRRSPRCPGRCRPRSEPASLSRRRQSPPGAACWPATSRAALRRRSADPSTEQPSKENTVSRNQRFTLLGLAVVVIAVAFVIARSGGNDSKDSSSTSTTSNGTGGAAPQDANVVVVKNAKPVGGIKRLTFKKGGTVDFTVKSDTADEIHFHGYDIAKDVEAGGSVHFKTPAKIDGRFEVELEDHKEQIAEIEVDP